jgi:hypothetical protein
VPEYIDWLFSQGALSQTLAVVGLLVLLSSIAQLCRILADACMRAARSWMRAVHHARRAARARDRDRR